MDLFKKPYEISLWEDVLEQEIIALNLVTVDEDDYEPGKYYSEKSDALGKKPYELDFDSWDGNKTYYSYVKSDSPSTATTTATISYYKEVKLCIIGSNTMDSQSRCINPKLVRKINGENTLTFTMYYRYVDNRTGEKTYNPFNKYMVNERKVKLRVGEGEDAKWYDFIIKNVQENSETCAFTYTCKDQFVNELSKTGFELVFDNELENNMGTVDYLAGKILEGSDWEVKPGDNLKQFIEEPLYKIGINAALEGVKILETGEAFTMSDFKEGENRYIYAFYSQINNQEGKLQFLYTEEADFKTNDDLIIDKVEHPNYIIENTSYKTNGQPFFAKSMDLSDDYRGLRLVRPIQTKYDSTIDKYVTVYEKGGEEYYGFVDTEYISPNTVSNYIVNPNTFTNTNGWYTEVDDNGVRATVAVETNPPITSTNLEGAFTSYLEFSNNGTKLMNTSIAGFRSAFKNGLKKKDEFIFRIKYKTSINGNYIIDVAPIVQIGKYKLENDKYDLEETLFDFTKVVISKTNEETPDSNFIYLKAACKEPVSVAELKNINNRYGLFITFNGTAPVFVEDAQLFPYVLNSNNELCVPGGNFDEVIKTIYKYYKPDPTWSSIDDLVVVDSGESPVADYNPKYPDGTGATAFTKVRSISAKESNRYNLIQDLCEKFECWAKFSVDRDETSGEISMTQDPTTGVYHQNKYVQFQEYVGIPNHAGFRYGVNSKSIQRTLDSNAIISKMIVKDNANEFAPRGFCSIARASDNPTKENFLISFDHYVRQGLLNMATVTNDLYLDSNGYLGYYKKLKRFNVDRDSWIDLQTNLSKDIMNYEASAHSYKKSYDAAVEERISAEQQIVQLVSSDQTISFQDAIKLAEEDSKWPTETKYISLKAKWAQCRNIEQQHGLLYPKAETMRNEAQKKYDEISEALDELADKKRALNLQFYKKYSRFIQEGSWIKEDYVDDNLYYLDAESTLHTSTQPKVSYTINVIDLAQLGIQNQSDYSYYKFDIGDITYIEDTEFFGWSLIDGKTPYREEIVVSEITDELDAPDKNVIKVQNYKTQFEDLFQRITAQTQQAEYHTGEFKRAANVVQPGGTISFSVLENSLLNNAMRLENARDQSVVIDEYGITSTSLTNPSEMVRLVAGGIFMSTDGGQTWRTGITGTGINTSYLTAGQLNVDEIYIMSGSQPAFRWDRDGLSAYTYSEIGNNRSYNLNKYVRFDQNGIYGRLDKEGEKDEDYKNVKGIMENAPFALTWDGFALNGNGGAVRITNTEDIQVFAGKGGVERIKIGRLDKDNQVYGLRIKDASGAIVMETDSNGQLWLKDKLQIGTSQDTYMVQIGNLGGSKDDEIDGPGQVINASGKFIVYEDGTMEANAGRFSGVIIANDGKIGGFNMSGGILTSIAGDEDGLPYLTLDGNSGTINIRKGLFSGELVAPSGTIGGFNIAGGNLTSVKTDGDGAFVTLNGNDGTINVRQGTFTGTITAKEGQIGGFSISENELTSTAGDYIGSEENKKLDPYLILNGQNGEIYAKNITLGSNAVIEEYIQLGNAFIRNPNSPKNPIQNLFIAAGESLRIYDTGKIELGINSEIYGDRFSITPELATFSNINCSGTIRTAVFEKGKVQGVGGAMLFKPSYKNKDTSNNGGNLILKPEIPEDESSDDFAKNFAKNGWILLVGHERNKSTGLTTQIRKKAKIVSVAQSDLEVKVEAQIVEINNDIKIEDFVVEMLTILGADKDISIGINSMNTGMENLLNPKGLTIAELTEKSKDGVSTLDINTRVFLGDLQTFKDQDGVSTDFGTYLSGYGLYCNNAYLQGALMSSFTKGGQTTYAGINTNSLTPSNKFESDETPIVFWGGASSLGNIKEATFQVTAAGSLYATNASFENSVIAGSTITGSKIYTAEIHPKDAEAALKIYNTGLAEGIQFIKEKDDEIENDKEITTLAIDYQGLSAFGEYFINLNSDNKEIYFSLNGESNRLEIKDNEISMQNINRDSKNQGGFLRFEPDKISLGYGETESIKEKAIDISITQIELLKATHFQSGIFYESNQYEIAMEYRPTENGYDLYVS